MGLLNYESFHFRPSSQHSPTPPSPSSSLFITKSSQGFQPCGKFKFLPTPSRSLKVQEVTRQRWVLPAELSRILSQPISRYTFLSSPPSGATRSPQSCSLARWAWAVGSGRQGQFLSFESLPEDSIDFKDLKVRYKRKADKGHSMNFKLIGQKGGKDLEKLGGGKNHTIKLSRQEQFLAQMANKLHKEPLRCPLKENECILLRNLKTTGKITHVKQNVKSSKNKDLKKKSAHEHGKKKEQVAIEIQSVSPPEGPGSVLEYLKFKILELAAVETHISDKKCITPELVQEGEHPNRLEPKNPVYAEETSPSVIVNGFSERLQASHIQKIRPHSENLVGSHARSVTVHLALFIYMMDYIDRFAYVEPSLHLWDEAYLIIMNDFSNVFLDSVCQYFIENFRIDVHDTSIQDLLAFMVTIEKSGSHKIPQLNLFGCWDRVVSATSQEFLCFNCLPAARAIRYPVQPLGALVRHGECNQRTCLVTLYRCVPAYSRGIIWDNGQWTNPRVTRQKANDQSTMTKVIGNRQDDGKFRAQCKYGIRELSLNKSIVQEGEYPNRLDPQNPVYAEETSPSVIVNGFSERLRASHIQRIRPHSENLVQEGEYPNRLDPQNPVYAEETSPSVIVNGFSERLLASHVQRIWLDRVFVQSQSNWPCNTFKADSGLELGFYLEAVPKIAGAKWKGSCLVVLTTTTVLKVDNIAFCAYYTHASLEEMGRHQCKNSSNSMKGNMTSPESRDHETRRIEHPTQEDIEEIDYKQNYMKIIEELKQEVKNCHKEMEIANKKQKPGKEELSHSPTPLTPLALCKGGSSLLSSLTTYPIPDFTQGRIHMLHYKMALASGFTAR
ncbi:hypothetical protein U0070_003128 [Myodes glareolus]|uniref:Murine leukemia virus integrase C-terminal domain-containing protein n=1 Tax=Myodes glareolus TaxID=447135 RepID=A0AAW0HAY2_MYOGA